MTTLVVRNEAQKVLFEGELQGQLSDGFWENTRPHNHWKPWCDATVVVGPNVGRNFYAEKSNYNFCSKDLLDVVGDRMLESVQQHVPGYTRQEMVQDLKDLKQIVRTFRAGDTAEKAREEAERQARVAAAEARRTAVQDARAELERLAAELLPGQRLSTYDNKVSVEQALRLAQAALRPEREAETLQFS